MQVPRWMRARRAAAVLAAVRGSRVVFRVVVVVAQADKLRIYSEIVLLQVYCDHVIQVPTVYNNASSRVTTTV